MWQAREPSAATGAMDGATSFFQDMLYYVQDVLDAGGPWLSYRLATHLHVTFFRPVVLEGLAGALDAGACGNNNNDNNDDDNNKGNNKSSSNDSTNGELVQLALYALCQVFAVMTDGPLLAAVAADLFSFGCVAGGSGGGSVVGSGSGEPVAAATELAGSASVVTEAEESEGETRSRPVASSGASDGQGRDRYCRALAACVARRRAGGGAQTRLGAVALVRSAIVNPTVGKAILRGGTPSGMLPGFEERGGGEGAGGGGGGGGGDTGVGNGTHCSTRGQERNARFEQQVMLILLEALTGPPPPSSAATVRTAAAAVGEFWLLEQSSSRGGPRISRGSGADHSGGHANGGIIGGGGVGGVGVSSGFGGGGGAGQYADLRAISSGPPARDITGSGRCSPRLTLNRRQPCSAPRRDVNPSRCCPPARKQWNSSA
ncbi:unnamed protein product [Laminaria digitata]